MSSIEYLESSDFKISELSSLKAGRLVYVVFSTLGEREADILGKKLVLIRKDLAGFVDGVFLSHRRRAASMESTEARAVESYPGIEIILCGETPVPDMGEESGKGSDMRRALYRINREFRRGRAPRDVVVVFLDADVVTEFFGPHFILGLAGGVLKGFDFAKAGFWRAMGRVKKFVSQPLNSVIEHPSLDTLRGFSYPLSGECAGTLEFFNSVNFWQAYGIETGINVDSSMGDYRIADVNLGLYDHEHRPEIDIQKMSFSIIRCFLVQMSDYGLIEFKNGASVSDVFRAVYIDENGSRREMKFDLQEKKYDPLKKILG